ncbi:hypothetical protein MMC29_000742 [Sticta canariensis]|nr:hypothetical protein [Sticta canariensis]
MLLFQAILGQVVLLLSFLIGLSLAAAPLEMFTNPPTGATGLTYTRGSIIQITFETHLRRIALTLWYGDGTDLEYLPDSINITNTGSYPWSVGSVITSRSSPTVTSETDIADKVYYFGIFDPGNTTAAFLSGRFRIVDPPSASSSTYSTSSSSSSTSASSPSSPASNIATSTQTVISMPSSSQDPSTATNTNSGVRQNPKTGFGRGIGVAVGIPLILAMGI